MPPELADQIAAGEVVERAASVVKELCENSLDAGARRIEVDVEGGGRRLIRVVDDGSGMTADEARLALRRHATSKLRAADDLWRLSTFGFRGEALPSIAAVSRLALSTKTPGQTAGFRLTVEAGIEVGAREVGIPDGTQIEVRDLFFNTPARLKFQKTESTEATNVSEALLRLALAHPDVHFRLKINGRTALDLPPHRDLGERVRAALARRGAGALVEAEGSVGGHQVRAFFAAPNEASTAARSAFLYVGRRYVRDRALLHALAAGYGDRLEKGRYPLAVLFVEVPSPELDVNVHPQKLEVRFARATEVYAAVRQVIAAGVARAPWGALPAEGPIGPGGRPEVRGAGTWARASGVGWRSPVSAKSRGETSAVTVNRAGTSLRDGDGEAAEDAASDPFSLPAWAGRDDRPQSDDAAAPWDAGAAPADAEAPAAGATRRADDGNEAERPRLPGDRLRFLGPIGEDFLAYAISGGLVLVDPHGLRERRALAQLRAELADGGKLRRQGLLFPVPVDGLPARALAACAGDACGTLLGRLGFDVRPLDAAAPRAGAPAPAAEGGGCVIVHAMPVLLADAAPKPLLTELLGELAATHAEADETRALEVMACHAARLPSRAGGESDGPFAAASELIDDDFTVRGPHDRRAAVRLSAADIDALFEGAEPQRRDDST